MGEGVTKGLIAISVIARLRLGSFIGVYVSDCKASLPVHG